MGKNSKQSEKAIKDLAPKATEEVQGGKGEMLSNVSKTRAEIAQTFARNARA